MSPLPLWQSLPLCDADAVLEDCDVEELSVTALGCNVGVNVIDEDDLEELAEATEEPFDVVLSSEDALLLLLEEDNGSKVL